MDSVTADKAAFTCSAITGSSTPSAFVWASCNATLNVISVSPPNKALIVEPLWQQTYFFPEDEPVMVASDTVFHMSCSFNNSPSNQQIVNGEQLEPRDVTWGDSTLDEMCLTYLLTEIPASLFE